MSELGRVIRDYVDGPYGQIHLRHCGNPMVGETPLVCLHMSPKSSRGYQDILPWLAQDRFVLAPDNPGHGESDLPPASPAVTIEDYARSAWAAIDAFTDRPVHLLGYHTGSMVAVEAASQRPECVRGVINISAPIFTPEEAAELDAFFDPIPMDRKGQRFTIMWQRVLDNQGPGVDLEMLAESFAENLRAGPAYEWGHRAAFAYCETYNRKIGEIEHPLLVANPQDDCWEVSQRADDLWRDGRRVDCPDWGHGFMNAYPEDAARLFLDFLEQYDGPS